MIQNSHYDGALMIVIAKPARAVAISTLAFALPAQRFERVDSGFRVFLTERWRIDDCHCEARKGCGNLNLSFCVP